MTWDYSLHYAKFHPDDPGHRRGLTLLHQRMLAPHLPAERATPILDVGCGRGYALEDIQTLGYTQLSGVETDAGQAASARARGLAVVHASSTEAFLADKPGAYAAILLMDVLEHVPRENQQRFLLAITRSLRPQGRLICSVPNAGSAIAGFWLHNDYTHHLSFTSDSLSFLLEQSGFGPVRCIGVEFFPRPRYLFWLPSGRTLAWLLRCWFRARRRAEFVAELGWARGRTIILTPNLLAVAEKART